MPFLNVPGQLVPNNESLFTYGPDESVASFSFPDHIPPFLDDIIDSLSENSNLTNICGDNAECLFDFDQTGDPDVGMAAMMFEDQTTVEMLDSSKTCILVFLCQVQFYEYRTMYI